VVHLVVQITEEEAVLEDLELQQIIQLQLQVLL
jgi:hypothetical protein